MQQTAITEMFVRFPWLLKRALNSPHGGPLSLNPCF
jgi:hypothetical protein